jgi:PAT family beta-lactamase induction signal transducer AmpG
VKERWEKIYRKFSDGRIVMQLFLGFSGGLPFLLTGQTFNHWLKKSNVSLTEIGFLAIIAAPYFLRFLWAPIIDHTRIPYLTDLLGQRRSWALLSQTCLIISILALSFCNPVESILITAFCAFLVALSSATQDTVLDAYRVEILDKSEYGIGSSNYVLGYRIGIMVAGSGAIFLSTILNWNLTYRIVAILVLVGMITILRSPEPHHENRKSNDHNSLKNKPKEQNSLQWYGNTIWSILKDFSHQQKWGAVIAFIMLYKISDNLLGGMFNPFLLDIGFLDTSIAWAQNVGLWTSIFAATLAGILISRFGLFKIMILCGILEAASNLMFVLLAKTGASLPLLYTSTIIENITSGMAVAAYVTFLSSVCSVSYTATHYAIMTSLSSFGRIIVSLPSGWIAEHHGWSTFFTISALAGIPAVILLFYVGPHLLNKRIDGNETDDETAQKTT